MIEYIKLDECSPDGTFTIPSKERINMLYLCKYCKVNNIDYENLTEEEIKSFIIK